MTEQMFDVALRFGSNVFNDSVMRERLPENVYIQMKKIITGAAHLESDVAEVVAEAMKDWAIERGATHYTHWFQPLNGMTAEKHDSFLAPTDDGHAIMHFSAKELIKGEPDASSFPSGGLRATFEARGYTAWDCTSPAFLRESASGVTLCIPSTFLSYTGEALDEKTPLLRSMGVINTHALRVLRALGNTDATRVIVNVGAEQEYFLLEKDMYKKRLDLVLTGRTLLGARPPKGQELDDHYFGVIKERVSSYMRELDVELWKMGVTAKTKHNEVAPSQHELAPIFTTLNIACDQNQVIMETMQRVADHHDLACLLHEKPFSYINGSGKHNNWSLSTDTGTNLLRPGSKPEENLVFLLFLSAIIKAVDENAALLRMTAATPGNDLRLGACEAPPAILSIYLGSQLTDMLDAIEEDEIRPMGKKRMIAAAVPSLPDIKSDNADRNRTSPMAFTGNKFEFRMLPSSASISMANTVLNTIVANELDAIASRLETAQDITKESYKIVRENYAAHKRILFNGNGYAREWVEEAEKRGLPNISNMVDSIAVLAQAETIGLFEKYAIMTKSELMARYEVKYENYIKQISVESKTLIDIVRREVMPAANRYLGCMADTIHKVQQVMGIPPAHQMEQLFNWKEKIDALYEALEVLIASQKVLEKNISVEEMAALCRDQIFTAMERIRVVCDDIELLMDVKAWPLPSYPALLFSI